MKLYLIRHGESAAKKKRLEQTSETPLSDRGQKQAEAVAERFKNIKIDSIYSSAHLRARQTAEIISQKTGVSVEYWEHLAETNTSEETFDELNERTKKVLEHLISHHKDQNVVCVSHATMIEAIIDKMIFGADLTSEIMAHIKKHLGTVNTGVSITEFTEKDGWILVAFNDFGHL